MEPDRLSQFRQYAWNYFSAHADQRLKTFNFYAVLASALAAELFYRHYQSTPVTSKFLCTVVKVLPDDSFIITAYYTETIKRGEVLWEKK